MAAKTPRKRHSGSRTTQVRNVERLAEQLFAIEVNNTIESQLGFQAKATKLLAEYGGKSGVNGAINALNRHADKISGGSTMEMVESGYIRGTISHYQMLGKFRKMHENPLLTDAVDKEMLTWLELEEQLQQYIYGQQYAVSWGGTIINSIMAFSSSQLESDRHDDITRLASLTPVATEKDIPAGFDNLAKFLTNSIKDNMPAFDSDALEYDAEAYRSNYAEMEATVEHLPQYVNAWIEARKQLASHYGNPADVYRATDSFVKEICKTVIESQE